MADWMPNRERTLKILSLHINDYQSFLFLFSQKKVWSGKAAI